MICDPLSTFRKVDIYYWCHLTNNRRAKAVVANWKQQDLRRWDILLNPFSVE